MRTDTRRASGQGRALSIRYEQFAALWRAIDTVSGNHFAYNPYLASRVPLPCRRTTEAGAHTARCLPLHRQVEAMAAYGVPEESIARVVGIDPKTLRRHYREELDTGQIKA